MLNILGFQSGCMGCSGCREQAAADKNVDASDI